jgi:hypothetical protein
MFPPVSNAVLLAFRMIMSNRGRYSQFGVRLTRTDAVQAVTECYLSPSGSRRSATARSSQNVPGNLRREREIRLMLGNLFAEVAALYCSRTERSGMANAHGPGYLEVLVGQM